MSKNWAICIGINEYYNLQPLKYAVQDASSIRDFFLQEAQFEQVYYFAEGAPSIETPRGSMRPEPTYANLKRFFRERFQRKFLDVGDNFWFFFAGHGELHEGHDYLMPLDVDPGNLEETALRISDVTAYLRNCGADNTVLLLDACRSQGQRQGLGLGTEEQRGMVTVYSCSPRESSYEIEALQHGSFTYALLEGFALQGATNCATVERLDQYLRHQVPRLNGQYGKPTQTPYTAVEPLSKNCLILLPRKATLQDVQALKIAAQQAEFITEDLALAQQLWVRVLAASTIDQDAIAAIGRIALKKAQQTTSPGPQGTETAGSRSVESPTSPSPQTQSMPPEYYRGFTSSTSAPPPVPPDYRVERVATPTPPKPIVPTFEFEVVTVNEQVQITQRKQSRVEYRQEDLGYGVTLDLVLIPGGTFKMGSPSGEGDADEKPQHSVTVAPFLMGKYPVTQAQYQAVIGKNPSKFTDKGANRPVERVSWDSAVEFCQKLSQRTGRDYRLPSEAEWEYACRAGTTTPFHFGPTITTDLVNYNGNYTYGAAPKGKYRQQTTAVGSFPANAFGLYDLYGNVREWCLDHWHENYQGAPTDGSAWTTGGDDSRRVLRGGSWVNDPWYCRSAYRDGGARVTSVNFVGFRVVCASSWALS